MSMSGPLLLGVDIGTGSSKAVLTDVNGAVLHTAYRAHGTSMPRPGWFEAHAEAMWWAEVVALCRDLLAEAGSGDVAALCVSGVGPALVLTDSDLRPLRPAILYGIDTRAEQQIDELTARYGEEQILKTCGKVLSTQALGPKLRWVQLNEPEVWAKARYWFGASSFIVAKLCGEYVLDRHTASQCDPMYDLREQTWTSWATDICGHLPLPRLAWPTEVVGHVTMEAAQQTGLLAGTPVVAGTIDAWAEGFSAGARRPGDLMLMYGSTMFFVQVLSSMRTHRMLWTTAGVAPGSLTVAAGMSTSGTLTNWVKTLTGDPPFEDLIAEAAAVPPGSGGLLLLPYFAGERTPIFDPRARGVLAGLSLHHTRGHLFRAAYEGIAFGIRQIVDILEEGAEPPRRIFAVGGGTKGGLWTQIVSDVTGREQRLPAQTIGASYGDALMAAIGIGIVPPETDWTELSSIVTPNRLCADRYDSMYRLYRELYPATRAVVHQLAAIQAGDVPSSGAGLPG